MRIRELLSTGRPCISFEFFPPRDEAGVQRLRRSLASLRELRPSYVSVTYGAGGSTRRQTLELVTHIQDDYQILPMAHLTCLGASRDELRDVLAKLADAGVENVLTLRGDPPRGDTEFRPHPDGFAHASELAAFARSEFSFCLGGACYPEKHPEAESMDADLAHLKAKVDAGCEFLITQLFFDNQRYFDFVARARACGIGVPIIPGIMPITNVAQVDRFTKMCGASIPSSLWDELQRLRDDPHAVLSLGVAHATAQCIELLNRGAPGIHFYTLNKSAATRTILKAIQTVYPPARTPAGSWD
ncbi:MAG: methylenetetrahydrofolate reductase [NAD(P)H] [Planctomycetota bacterium]|nr:MAG: methylenetetrahydrofolate reductase [NAD(P)H] [Planctomycetota bacterium]